MVKKPGSQGLLITLMILSMVIWGGTWPSAKAITGAAPSEVIAFVRFLVTSIAFLPIVLFTRSSLRIGLRSLLYTLGASLSIVFYNLAFFGGLREGLAGAGGVLVPTLSPILTFIFVQAAGRIGGKGDRPSRPHWIAIVGLILGLIGGAVILQVWRIGAQDITKSGNLYFLLGAALWAAVGIFSQQAQGQTPFIPFSFLMYSFSAIISFPFALRGGLAGMFDGRASSLVDPVVLWLNIAYLGIVAMAFATTVFFLSTARIGASRASSFMFIVPTAAVILSWLFLGEVPAVATLIGGALSIAAVYMVNFGSARSTH